MAIHFLPIVMETAWREEMKQRVQTIFWKWSSSRLKAVIYFHTVSFNAPKMDRNKCEETKTVLLLGMMNNDVWIPLVCKISQLTRLDGNSTMYFDEINVIIIFYHKFYNLLCMLSGSFLEKR